VTASQARQDRPRSLVVPLVVAIPALAVLIGLGLWQLDRKAWKENLIATLQQRLSAPPVALPAPEDWPKLTRDNAEFRRVRLRADYLDQAHVHLYASGSALRDDVKAPGYFVFAPARLAAGQIVVVNAGYVPDRQHAWTGGSSEIVGTLRWPESPSWFVSDHDALGSIWFVRDHREMAKLKHWGDRVAPFYIEQESPVPSGGLPRPGKLSVKLRNDHLGYALTWFGLAAALVIIFALFALRQRRANDG
jgi:surfeit locus 1 family protein